jgi:hypothetical protein
MPNDQSVIDSARDLVEADIAGGFVGILNAEGPNAFSVELPEATLAFEQITTVSEAVVVPVPWRFHCVHRGHFLGIPPTHVELDLRGTTFVLPRGDSTDDWLLYRYIDYLGALHQMGVSAAVRPALTPDQYANWLANQP